MKKLLTIAGADPSGGAGIQADLRTFEALGLSAYSVITAVTAQDEHQFVSVNPVMPPIFKDQLSVMEGKEEIVGVKIGMLGTLEILRQVVKFVKSLKKRNSKTFVVLDPILTSSTGMKLLESRAVGPLVLDLIPLCDLVTPNIPETQALLKTKIHTLQDMKRSLQELFLLFSRHTSVLIKGGHLKNNSEAVDLLFDGKKTQSYKSSQKWKGSVHGTGCVLSSAILSYVIQGYSLIESVQKAKQFLESMVMQNALGAVNTIHARSNPKEKLKPRRKILSGDDLARLSFG